MAKFLKFYFEYKSLLNQTHRVEVWEEGTTTTTIELQSGANPFITENNNDVAEKYLGGIVPTVATITAAATSDFNSAYFSKQKYGDYVIKFLVNGSVKSNAILTPFESNDIDLNGGYPITLSAECGLRNLKSKPFTPTNTRVKLISVLKSCLAQIGFIDTFSIKVIDNTKCYDGTVLDSSPSKYWESYCDDIDFEGLNCYEVIDRIRKPYNQVFFDHVNGCWFVRNIDEISSQNSVIRTYDWAALTFSDATYNRPVKSFTDRQDGNFGRMFSHQSVIVKKGKSNMPIRNSWGKMDNLTGWTFAGTSALYWVINDGRLYNSKTTFSTPTASGVDGSYIESPQFLYTPYQTFSENEKIYIEADVNMGSVLSNLRMQIITGFNGEGGIPNFLSTDGNWYSVENDNSPSYAEGKFFGTPIFEAKPSGDKLKIEIPRPPYHANNAFMGDLNKIGSFGYWNNPFDTPFFPEEAEYYLIIRLFYPERNELSEAAGVDSTDEMYGLFIDNLHIKVGDVDINIAEGFERKFTLNDIQDRETDLTVDVGIGYPSYPTGTDSLFKSTSDSSLVKYYSKDNAITSDNIDVFISNSYLKVLGKRLQTYQGTVREALGFSDLVSIMGVKYRLHNAKYNARMHYTDIKAVELATNSTSTITEGIILPNDVKKDIEDQVNKAVTRVEIPEFSSVNFEKKVLPNGKTVVLLNDVMKMRSAFADVFYSKASSGGIITTEAEDTEDDFTQIKPAASGTYALQEWVNDSAWLLGGSDLTSPQSLGSKSGNFDIPIIRNNTTVAVINAKGISFPTIQEGVFFEGARDFVLAGIDLADTTKQLIRVSASQAVEFLSPNLWKKGGNFLGDDDTIGSTNDYNVSVIRNNVAKIVLGSTVTDFDATIFNFKNGATNYAVIGANGLGIGTTSPLGKIHVRHDITDSLTESANAMRLYSAATGNGTAGTLGSTIIFGQRWLNSNTTPIRTGGIAGIKTAADGSFGGGVGLLYQTAANVDLSIGAVLTHEGNFGIGTLTPSYKLDVIGNGHFSGAVTFDTVPSSLQDATSANHLVRYSQWIGATYLKPYTSVVKTVSFTSLTKSGIYAINGYTPTSGEYVLDAFNDTGSGIWVVDSGAWSRPANANEDVELRGFIVSIQAGTYAGYKYLNTNTSAITINTTPITYSEWSNTVETDPIFTNWRDASRTAKTVFAAPNGSNGLPSWRALVASDISDISTNYQAKLPTGTAGQFLVRDSTEAVNFMDLKIKPIGLSSERIGVGNVDNFLGEQPYFLFKDKRYIQVSRITDNTKQLNIGLVKKSNHGFIEQLGGSLNITATGGLYMTDFASPNQPLRMLTIDSLGKLSVSSIQGGGAAQSSLTTTHVGFGVNNVLSSSANFAYLSDRYLHFTGSSANVNIGATGSGSAGFLESVNGNLLLQARSTFGVVVDDGFFQVNDLAGSGTRMVVASSTGVLSTQTIPSGGGVPALTAMNIGYGDGSNLMTSSANFQYDATKTVMYFNDGSNYLYVGKSASLSDMYEVTAVGLRGIQLNTAQDIVIKNDNHLYLGAGANNKRIHIGRGATHDSSTHYIVINGENFSFSMSNISGWGDSNSASTPQVGDKVLFNVVDVAGQKRFVPQKINKKLFSSLTSGDTVLIL